MASVLVIDDLQSELDLIAGYLSEAGHAVSTALSAADGIEQAVSGQPDAIVTDFVMPGMSGLEMCRKLKKLPETASIPLIACTTKDRATDRTWAMKQGISAYITKPFEKAELLDAVSSVLA